MAAAVWALALCFLLTGSLPASGQSRADRQMEARALADIRAYHELVTAYGSSESDSATTLLGWDRHRLQRARELVHSKADPYAPWDERRHRLAAMMHTDAALRTLEDSQADRPGALTYFTFVADDLAAGARTQPELRAFAQRWFIATNRYLRALGQRTLAFNVIALGRGRLPDEGMVLYDSAVMAEEAAESVAARDHERDAGYRNHEHAISEWSGERSMWLNDAAKWLRAAVLLNPDDDLARLHLGRVEALRLNDNDALKLLGQVIGASKDDATVYLAGLFIAGLRVRQGRLIDAAAAYRVAIARFPAGHSAYIGLSHALQGLGRVDESRATLAMLLGGKHGPVREPRWWYFSEPPGVAVARFDALRAEVRQ